MRTFIDRSARRRGRRRGRMFAGTEFLLAAPDLDVRLEDEDAGMEEWDAGENPARRTRWLTDAGDAGIEGGNRCPI